MRRFFKRNKKFLGIFFLISAVLFFIFWEFAGRNRLLYEEVIVLNTNAMPGTLITSDIVKTASIDVNNIVENSIRDSSQILGMEAKYYIPANAQLVHEYFDEKELVLNADQKIMKLPTDWIHSYPQTLRRKDMVYLYAINSDTRDNKENTFILNTIVAYVKDNTNREVESADTNRLVGSSTISVIEIIITDKEFGLLKDYAGRGYTFALLYD